MSVCPASFPVPCGAPRGSPGRSWVTSFLSLCVSGGVFMSPSPLKDGVAGCGTRVTVVPFQPSAVPAHRQQASQGNGPSVSLRLLVGRQLLPHGFQGSPFVFGFQQCVCDVSCSGSPSSSFSEFNELSEVHIPLFDQVKCEFDHYSDPFSALLSLSLFGAPRCACWPLTVPHTPQRPCSLSRFPCFPGTR